MIYEELNPCIVCKTKEHLEKCFRNPGQGFEDRYWVRCKKCGKESYKFTSYYEEPDRYTKYWNEENPDRKYDKYTVDATGQEVYIGDIVATSNLLSLNGYRRADFIFGPIYKISSTGHSVYILINEEDKTKKHKLRLVRKSSKNTIKVKKF